MSLQGFALLEEPLKKLFDLKDKKSSYNHLTKSCSPIRMCSSSKQSSQHESPVKRDSLRMSALIMREQKQPEDLSKPCVSLTVSKLNATAPRQLFPIKKTNDVACGANISIKD